ncbi:MAG: M1 family metallopeptidase [Myxococcales bacterium]|nr:M1 family metallopeptidase [Myxococcales bacterium]
MARLDPHSYNDSAQPEARSLALRARVDLSAKTLEAEAELSFSGPASGRLDLDTRELSIEAVEDGRGARLPFTLHPSEPILGSRLSIELPADTRAVRIRYRTSPSASALQWLEPEQTHGKREPFLFSQCQAIHARSVVPIQDTPRIRIRYRAELWVPRRLEAVMAAAPVGRREEGEWAVESFEMPQPIPPYLLAFAVGDLAAAELSPRSRVWAEPPMLERAAREFGGVEEMIRVAERLFGPYEWDRFDLLTMPPSFPYGGMENPRLTFLTPTIVAGDRSLVNVVAHELAHSWTGNLITNANAEHFWLNEGFTVYAERRILEALEGEEMCALHAAIGRRSLEEAIVRFERHPELTRLRTHLSGVDPDEAYSQVPYEKGYLFLRTLEEAVGRDAFTRWLRRYIEELRFQSITTEDFERHIEGELPGALAKADAKAWLDGPGLPRNAPAPRSSRLEAIESLGGRVPEREMVASWTPAEWQLYLESVPKPAPLEACRALDERYGLTRSGNYEVLVSWLSLAASSSYRPALPKIEQVLGEVGRMKYLRPLYAALARDPETRPLAHQFFERYRQGYHPIARQVIHSVLSPA